MLTFFPETDLATNAASLLVNTTNTKGVMGKGVALVVKRRFPEIMPAYEAACRSGRLVPGTIQLIPVRTGQTVLNMATKDRIYEPSRYDWVGSGLVYLNRILCERAKRYPTVAMPLPGCGNGGLDPVMVSQMIRLYLHRAGNFVDLAIAGADLAPIDYPRIYAGVGSRETPDMILSLMEETASLLAEDGLVLRSGGARGADSAFYRGAMTAGGRKEIFLARPRPGIDEAILHLSPVQERMALAFHPKPDAIRPDPAVPDERRLAAFHLMARNGNQVFGVDFRFPSDLILCWTEGGKGGGGTGQAIRLAESVGIPVLDLGRPDLRGILAPDLRDMALELIAGRRRICGLPCPERSGLVTDPLPC